MSESSDNLNTEEIKAPTEKSWWEKFIDFGEASLRGGRDPVIILYSEKNYDCYKPVRDMGFLELLKKRNEYTHVEDKGLRPESYKNDFEKEMVTCARNLLAEKYMYFGQYYKVESSCKEMCEVEYPKGSGTMNFIRRHKCRRDCEDKFLEDVRPLVNYVEQEYKNQKKREKENINL
jgi:hypothetical protein